MLKRVDNSVLITGTEFIENGRIAGGYMSFGLADGGVDFAVNEFNEGAIAPYLSQLNELKQMVINGEIVVPETEAVLYDWAAETF